MRETVTQDHAAHTQSEVGELGAFGFGIIGATAFAGLATAGVMIEYAADSYNCRSAFHRASGVHVEAGIAVRSGMATVRWAIPNATRPGLIKTANL